MIEVASGTQVAVISTEHTLTTVTDVATYVLLVDMSNMAASDVVAFRGKTDVFGSTTARTTVYATFTNAQTDPDNYASIPLPVAHSGSFTLKQTAGTGRSFKWSVVRL